MPKKGSEVMNDDDIVVTDEGGEVCCATCNKPTGKDGHMCVPLEKHDETCKWCGAMIMTERHMCNDKLQEVSYVCNTCGRVAIREDQLCNPKKIE